MLHGCLGLELLDQGSRTRPKERQTAQHIRNINSSLIMHFRGSRQAGSCIRMGCT